MKILIVEDEETLAKVLEEKLNEEGYDTAIARSGGEAVAMVKEHLPNLIVLDLILPEKHGLVVLEEIKADEKLKSIPVVVLSNLAEDENIKKAFDLGAQDYFVKTQHPLDEIVEKVAKYIRNPRSGLAKRNERKEKNKKEEKIEKIEKSKKEKNKKIEKKH